MERMCHKLAVDFFDTIDEPIAAFVDRDTSLLESALNSLIERKFLMRQKNG